MENFQYHFFNGEEETKAFGGGRLEVLCLGQPFQLLGWGFVENALGLVVWIVG